MANHEMKNLSQVYSGLATAPYKLELIMVASSWREVLQAGVTSLLASARVARGALEDAINTIKNIVLDGKSGGRSQPAARPFLAYLGLGLQDGRTRKKPRSAAHRRHGAAATRPPKLQVRKLP
jgi:hypothetical protein